MQTFSKAPPTRRAVPEGSRAHTRLSAAMPVNMSRDASSSNVRKASWGWRDSEQKVNLLLHRNRLLVRACLFLPALAAVPAAGADRCAPSCRHSLTCCARYLADSHRVSVGASGAKPCTGAQRPGQGADGEPRGADAGGGDVDAICVRPFLRYRNPSGLRDERVKTRAVPLPYWCPTAPACSGAWRTRRQSLSLRHGRRPWWEQALRWQTSSSRGQKASQKPPGRSRWAWPGTGAGPETDSWFPWKSSDR